jgi:hypothetical protein
MGEASPALSWQPHPFCCGLTPLNPEEAAVPHHARKHARVKEAQ